MRNKYSISLKIALSILVATLVAGTGFFFSLYSTVGEFSGEDVRHELEELKHIVYRICDTKHNDILLLSGPGGDRMSRIQKRRAMALIEEFAGEEKGHVVIFENDREILRSKGFPYPIDNLGPRGIESLGPGGYFMEEVFFEPWGWRIYLFKGDSFFAPLLHSIKRSHLVVAISLMLGAFALYFYLQRAIGGPVMRMAQSVSQRREPADEGPGELGYLSRGIGAMMRQLEEERTLLERQKAWAEGLIGSMNEAIVVIRSDFVVTFQNAVHRRLFGEIAGLDCRKAMKHPPGHCETCAAKDIFAGASYTRREYEVMTAEGRKFIDVSAAPIRGVSGEPLQCIYMVRDITQMRVAQEELRHHKENLEAIVSARTAELVESKRRLEEEIAVRMRMEAEMLKAQKMEALSVLAGGIAHDFNNIVGIIANYIALARQGLPPGSEEAARLALAEEACFRAGGLSAQLLTFSRGGAPVLKVASLARLITDCSTFALHGSGVKCVLDVAEDLSAVEFDEGQISQVLNNILINAVQATGGRGAVTIRARNVEVGGEFGEVLSPGSYVRVSIEDEGPGIADDIRDRIFEPFFTTKPSGAGLGLATSFSIVARHNGHITASPGAHGGSVFNIYLPASKESAQPPDSAASFSGTAAARVLLMDDEPGFLRSTAELLGLRGFDVAEATDGRKAVEAYGAAMERGEPFDVVVLDMTVPGGMGGREASEHILAMDKGARAIITTGYTSDKLFEDYKERGIADLLMKPFEIDRLAASIRALL